MKKVLISIGAVIIVAIGIVYSMYYRPLHTKETTVVVNTATESVLFYAKPDNALPFEFSLMNPKGEIITPKIATVRGEINPKDGITPDMAYVSGYNYFETPTLKSYEITSPPIDVDLESNESLFRGTWTLIATGKNVRGVTFETIQKGSLIDIDFNVFAKNGKLASYEKPMIGEPVILRAVITSYGSDANKDRIRGADVIATIEFKDMQWKVPLLDDGKGYDNDLNDGVYVGLFTTTLEAGFYCPKIKAIGTFDSIFAPPEPFERLSSAGCFEIRK